MGDNVMNTITTIFAIMIISAIPIMVLIAIHFEKKDFNNGFCPHCKSKLYFFDCDNQGRRGYKCEKCRYHTWVIYNTVDKDYWEK
jgi:tRNA(Ile2) C34 agmatinyltransferase TiaS